MCPQAERHDALLVRLVDGSKALGELLLGDVGAGRVEDVNDELTASEKTVGDEFARAQGDGGVVVGL